MIPETLKIRIQEWFWAAHTGILADARRNEMGK